MFAHLHPDPALLEAQKNTFRTHLEKLLRAPEEPSLAGLSYLPAPADYRYAPETSESVQLLVIGGTRTESILYRRDTREFTRHRHAPTPTLRSARDFLDLLRSVREPTSSLVLNFTFPMRPYLRGTRLDGTLLRGTKAHTLTDLIGKSIGAYLETHLDRHPQVVVVNDITVLLTSFASQGVRVAGVLGTGGNFGLSHAGQCVNLETGNYNDFGVDEAVAVIDRESDNPGAQLWEKSTSGKYLKDQFNYYAAQTGLSLRMRTSHELDDVHEITAAALGEAVYRRSASKVAVSIAALLEVTSSSTLVMEGGVFWEAYGYSNYVREYLGLLDHANPTIVKSTRPFGNLATLLD